MKYKNWNEISISNYKKISEICESDRTDLEKDLSILAILCDCSEDDIYDLTIPEAKALRAEMQWMKDFDFNKNNCPKHIKIKDKQYDIDSNLQHMSVSQYVDYQTFIKDRDNHMGNLLACFVMPMGHKYNEDYDVIELAQYLEDNVDICTYNSILFFSLANLVHSTQAITIYLDWLMKRMVKKEKNQETKQILMEKYNQLKGIMDGYLL